MKVETDLLYLALARVKLYACVRPKKKGENMIAEIHERNSEENFFPMNLF